MENISFDANDIVLLERTLGLLMRYGKIHTITGVTDAEGSHEVAIRNAEILLNEIIRPKLHKLNLWG